MMMDENVDVLYSKLSPEALSSLGDMEIDFDIVRCHIVAKGIGLI
jgi:hypothetical protein